MKLKICTQTIFRFRILCLQRFQHHIRISTRSRALHSEKILDWFKINQVFPDLLWSCFKLLSFWVPREIILNAVGHVMHICPCFGLLVGTAQTFD